MNKIEQHKKEIRAAWLRFYDISSAYSHELSVWFDGILLCGIPLNQLNRKIEIVEVKNEKTNS